MFVQSKYPVLLNSRVGLEKEKEKKILERSKFNFQMVETRKEGTAALMHPPWVLQSSDFLKCSVRTK